MEQKQEGRFSRIGRWLFYNHFLVTLLIGGVAVGVLALKNWTRSFKHIPSCQAIVIDLEAGTVSGLSPLAFAAEIKEQFPCYTGYTREGSQGDFGGGVFCKLHELYFYTHEDRIELRKGFGGEIAGITGERTIEQFTALLGEPQETNEGLNYEGGALYDVTYRFAMDYGELVLLERDGHIQGMEMVAGRTTS